MDVKHILTGIFAVLLIAIFGVYWFSPIQHIEFSFTEENSNFSLYDFGEQVQFYENMRFPTNEISYKIINCSMNQQKEMTDAFELVSNLTILNFSATESQEEILVSCDEKNRLEGGMFIAGEGGPTNITSTSNFNVISTGNILLIRESKCPKPNVAIHELLHVLGFNHSENKYNIMYPVSNCKQTIGDIPLIIDEIYSVPSYPDLTLEKASAIIEGKYLDVNMSVRNNGLVESKPAEVIISSNGDVFKKVSLDALDVGYGIEMSLSNIRIPSRNYEEISFEIEYNFEELNKENNKKKLETSKEL